jgi:uncharacterized membrane protein YbhN (UPF0104 family)
LIKAAFSMVFLFALSRFFSVSEAVRLVHALHWQPIAWAVAVHFLIAGLNAWKMDVLVGNPLVTPADFMRWNLIKLFVNNLLPGGLGGEVARTYYLGKAVGSMGGSAAVVVCDRLTAQAALSVFSAVALGAMIWGPYSIAAGAAVFLLAASAAVAAACGAFLFLSRLRLGHLRRALGGGPRTAWLETPGFQEFFALLRTRHATLCHLAWLSLLGQGLLILRLYFLVQAIAPSHSLLLLPIALSLASVLSSLPLTIGGIGLSEGGFALAFGLGSEAGAIGVSAALLLRLTSLVPAFIGWMLFIAEKKAGTAPREIPAGETMLPALRAGKAFGV